jgi:hypothetical protein
VIPRIDRHGTRTDFNALTIRGNIAVQLKNQGERDVHDAFQVTLYEDSDADGAFTPGADHVLGRRTYNETLGVGQATSLTIPVSGRVLFRGNLVYAVVDSGNVITEQNEANNANNTGLACRVQSQGRESAAPDLTASFLRAGRGGLPESVGLIARAGNGGAISVTAGVSVTFYAGNPAAGGQAIGITRTTRALSPGEYEDVSFTWERPKGSTRNVYVAIDDDGTGRGVIIECDEANNDPVVAVSDP